MRERLSRVSDTWFAVAAGLLCAAWAFIAWLTVIPNQDMLVDAIQAQSIIHDPRLVLAFPGQKHGGTVEYPLQVLAEWIAPGNYYAQTIGRVLLAFLTGLVTAKLFTTLYPKARRWAFLLAVAVGPTIIHGLSGPPGNRVGVWWLVGNYDTSWLLVTAGALVLSRAGRRRSAPWWMYLAAGLLVGLGFYAHPNITLLIVPLAVVVLLTYPIRMRQLLIVLGAAVVGAIPGVISYVINADLTTWDPSHPPFVAVSVYANVLGLDGIPNYEVAILPFALGLPTSQDVIPGAIQSAITSLFVVSVSMVALVGVGRAIVGRQRPSAGTILAVGWIGAFGAMIGFATFVTPVWFYATSLSILLWLSIGALPHLAPKWHAGSVLAATLICLSAFSTVVHNVPFYGEFPTRMAQKAQRLTDLRDAAAALELAGVEYIYGSYYDAVPIGYVSNWRLRTVTSTYDRFPLSSEELGEGAVVVGVNRNPTEDWARRALVRVTDQCTDTGRTISTDVGAFGVFECSPIAISNNR